MKWMLSWSSMETLGAPIMEVEGVRFTTLKSLLRLKSSLCRADMGQGRRRKVDISAESWNKQFVCNWLQLFSFVGLTKLSSSLMRDLCTDLSEARVVFPLYQPIQV